MTIVGVGVGPGFPTARPGVGPGFIPGCALWLCSDSGVTVVGGKVSNWADSSPAGNDFFQLTEARRPFFVPAAGGSPAFVEFEETNPSTQWLLGPSMQAMFGNKPLAIFVLCNLSGSAPDGIFGTIGGSGNLCRLQGGGAVYAGASLSWTRVTEQAVRALYHDGNDIVARVGGVEKDRATVPLATLSDFLAAIGFLSSDPLDSSVHQVLAYAPDSPLSLAQVQAAEAWLLGNCP